MATKTKYKTVIGLEVHAQLKTATKLFCKCSTKFGAKPNENTCPVCMGYPGVLPVLNEQAVEFAIKAGLALDCEIDPNCKFDRKQYFYPDLPKGYQISQFDKPICTGGKLTIFNDKVVNLERIHMEEDAGKLVHASEDAADRLHGSDYSLVDLNRAGTPLIEIVSKPDMSSAEEAVAYVKELRKILMAIGVCDGNMQEGSLRCDINISLNLEGEPLGTRAEIKNVNSFRSIARAIEYEYKRQSKLLDAGEKVVQETRLFEENSGKTFSMRSKEDSHDYRYFPEPDLVPLAIEESLINELRENQPELPSQKRNRYVSEFVIPEEAAGIIADDEGLAEIFEKAVAEGVSSTKLANWITGSISAYLNTKEISIKETKLSADSFAEMVKLIEEGTISDNIAKNSIIEELLEKGGSAKAIVERDDLAQITDPAQIEAIVQEVIDANQKQVEQFRSGNQKIKGFFVGQVMKATAGKASPQLINESISKLLK
ncbi:MAG: Asp-tRNA(Asn)/Glu-tRNA(Gln) amidotransferase subunit GatB [Candidatus Caenarcaniphilales bacterium]|nr:Asp-tRNA(Asn)/Glu-tRNA(Gln) amidotransferase subunit GatB [Candidatus Caenarcaniphilales bacterium]